MALEGKIPALDVDMAKDFSKVFSLNLNFIFYLIIILVVLLISPHVILAQNTSRLRLSDAIEIAIKNNRKIAILQKEVEKAKGKRQASTRIFQNNPDISWEVRDRKTNDQNIIDHSLSLSQKIEIRGQRHHRMKIAELNHLKTQLLLEKNKLVVTEEVKGIFIDLTSLNERLKAFETLLEVEEKLLQWIGVRAVYGEISSIALNTVNLEVLRTKAKILNIKQAIIEKRQELEWVMNTSIPEGMDINYRYPEIPSNIQIKKLLNYIDKHNFDIRIALADLEKAEYALKLSKAGSSIPSINTSLIYSREDRDNLIGIALSIPVPLFNRKKGEINAARAGHEKAVLELHKTREKYLSDMNKYYKSSTIKEQQKEMFVKQIIPITQENLNEIRMRYQKGEIGLTTIERYYDTWVETRVDYANFLQKYYHTLCKIELLLGGELNEVIEK